MRDLVMSTADRPGVIGGIGGFGGLFEVPAGYRRPVLVSSTDGVGTKMAVAMSTGRFTTVGIDLVAMCVDDLVCCGARPLFFLDYQLLGKVDPQQVRRVMTGIAEGCRIAGCAIVGGELAEHPACSSPARSTWPVSPSASSSAIASLTVRPAPASVMFWSACPRPGCVQMATPWLAPLCWSRGGRSLEGPAWTEREWTLADELLRPSVIYTPAILALLAEVEVHAIAHITGGGLPGNVPRVLAPDLDAVLERSRWVMPRIFAEIRAAGRVTDPEMAKVFNLGLGMVVAVPEGAESPAIAVLRRAGQDAVVVGRLVRGDRQAHIV